MVALNQQTSYERLILWGTTGLPKHHCVQLFMQLTNFFLKHRTPLVFFQVAHGGKRSDSLLAGPNNPAKSFFPGKAKKPLKRG
jgi:hypothetical protein